MLKEVLYLFLIGHLLGDYYFQSDKMGEKKEYYFLTLLLHACLYTGAKFISILPVYNDDLIYTVLLISGAHFVIDFVKYYIVVDEKYKTKVFIIDQLLHIITIFSAVIMMNNAHITVRYHEMLGRMDRESLMLIISWTLLILFIIKPVSVMIKQTLLKYTPENLTSDDHGHDNAGAFIGILERIMILVLLALNQYTMIGLVLTAKSITRYSKITEDPQFSEYYLLGTLLSTLSVVLSFIMIL